MDPVTLAGGGLSLASGLIKGMNGARAVRRRNAILTEGHREQGRYGIEGANMVNSAVSQLGASRPDVQGATQGFLGALKGMPQVGSTLPTVSGAFRDSAAGANAAVADRGGTLADLFGRTRAVTTQRQGEGYMMGRLGNDLQGLSRRAASSNFLNQLRAGSIQPNPWVDLAAGVGGNIGNYLMSGTGKMTRGAPISSDEALRLALSTEGF